MMRYRANILSVAFKFTNISKKKVLICPDKFKFSLTSSQVSSIIKRLLPLNFESNIIELADGGQGSLETISRRIKGQWIDCQVVDPLFRAIKSQYFLRENNQSYIQMAKASGLQLLSSCQRNPLYTTTYGTGQLILDSLKRGSSAVNLLIGGSATNQGGIGVANALGFDFKDENEGLLKPIGENLSKIKNIKHRDQKLKEMIQSTTIKVYTDVTNIFTGENGATKVYGPQKGATPQIVEKLQRGMQNLRQLFELKYGIDVNKLAGSGAAGGLGGGCSIFLNSQLHRGIDLIFSLTNFDKLVKDCDLIITGEGKVDRQTLEGKVVKGVIDRAAKYNKKVLVICAFCQNSEKFRSLQNVELVELLKVEQRKIIDPKLTQNRLQEFIKSYHWR